jgi:hypothetical protein
VARLSANETRSHAGTDPKASGSEEPAVIFSRRLTSGRAKRLLLPDAGRPGLHNWSHPWKQTVFLDRRGQHAQSPRFGLKFFPNYFAQTDDMGTERFVLAVAQYKVDLDVFMDLGGLTTPEENACRADVLRSSPVPIAFPEFAIAHRQFDRKALGLPILAGLDHPQSTIR